MLGSFLVAVHPWAYEYDTVYGYTRTNKGY